jgi:hypothetical protein
MKKTSTLLLVLAVCVIVFMAIFIGVWANSSTSADVSDLDYLPVVEDSGTVMSGTESNADPLTPPVVSGEKPLTSWADAESFFGQSNWGWYVAGLNARAVKTGFDWSDVQQWAEQMGTEVRLIHVFGSAVRLSDKEIRSIAAQDVGADVAAKLQIVRHPCEEVLVNTRGFGHDAMEDFIDGRSMVRVALAPLVYDECGKVIGLGINSGIFVDCYNLWWIVKRPPCTTTTATTLEEKHPEDFAPSATTPSATTPSSPATPATSGGSTAGPGAVTTVTTPTTVAVPVTVPQTDPTVTVTVPVPDV